MLHLLLLLLLIVVPVPLHAAVVRYLIPTASGGCVNGSTTYDPLTGTCGSGSATVNTGTNINSVLPLLAPGDKLQIRSGTYTTPIDDSGFTWQAATTSARITIEGYPGDAKPNFNVSGVSAINQTKTAAQYITFKDLNLSSTGAFREVIGTQGDFLRFENITATGNNSQTSLAGNIVLINAASHGNVFTGGRYHNPGIDVSGGFFSGDGYPFYVNGDNNTFEYLEIDNGRAYGVHNYCNGGGCGSVGNSNKNVYRFLRVHNVCQTLNTCAGILLGTGTQNLATRNIVYNVTGTGSGNIAGIAAGFGATDAVIYNNVVVGSKWSNIAWDNSSTGLIVKNNISSSPGVSDFWNGSTNNTTPPSGASGSHNRCSATHSFCSTTSSPGFTDATGDDYTLLSTSAMIGQGVSFIGNCPAPLTCTYTATSNGPVDIGAKETFSFASATTVDTSNFDVSIEAAFAPFTPSSGVTGWAMTVNTGAGDIPQTVTAVNEVSPSVRRVSCSACMSAGAIVKVSLAANTLRDTSASILGQPNFTITSFPVDNTLTGGGGLVISVEKIRIRKWSASLAGATEGDWLSTVNQSLMTIRNDGAYMGVAWQIAANGGTPPTVGFLTDYCAVNTSPCTPNIEVSDSDTVNALRYDNTNVGQAHGGIISATRLSNPEPTFISGGVVASTQGYPQPPLIDNSATEIQGMYYIKAGLPNGRVVCIRPRAASGYTLVHNQTACVTIGHPVASAQ